MFSALKKALYAEELDHAQRELNQLQQQLNQLNQQQIHLELDSQAQIINANQAFSQLYTDGYESLQGKSLLSALDTSILPVDKFEHYWQQVLQNQAVTLFIPLRKQADSIVCLQANLSMDQTADQQTQVVHCYANDCTALFNHWQGQKQILDALSLSQARIEFDLEGKILTANENFLQLIGYQLDAIKGKHHSIFLSQEAAASREYQQFWNQLRNGQSQVSTFKRHTANGEIIWVQGSYNPVLDNHGNVYKIVKLATDVTAEKRQHLDTQGQIQAISKAQAVIEFELDGTIIVANDNFLNALGYRLDEIKGKHHRIFIDSKEQNSVAYAQFWEQLNSGHFQSGEFKRLAKDGQDVWIRASYNPIFDMDGKPFKVVKYAYDITEEKLRNADFQGQIEAISRSQAVIEFEMDGTILNANENFLSTLGYRLEEIKGKHHSIFVKDSYRNSQEYSNFWQSLQDGKFFSDEFERIGKGGKSIWIQASYNPIFNPSGTPYKVVKYATDITERKTAINEINTCLMALASGDLSQRAQGQYDGEFDQLKQAVNGTMDRLESLVSKIQNAAHEVLVGATEIKSGNMDLSHRTESQAASLEETAASMEEMTAQVNESTINARDVSSVAKEAENAAVEGKTVVHSAIEAMQEINVASKRIADIIGTIDEIAFQTNLLALNAAVEAARAGDQGRGFAVVAGEVRSLAQRSAASAKEISQLITDSVDKVDNGARMVTECGEVLETIVQYAVDVSSKVSEIANASGEQQSGIEQVNQAISSIDDNTQQNSALMEEAAAATASMVEQVNQMKRELDFFQIRK